MIDADTRLLLNERDAAKMLSISPRTLWSLRAAGKISCVRIGAAVRYSVSDLQDFIRSQTGTEA